ncbi:transglutaminaseTgpA domain-containing protein [Nocardiopsis sediminis]|uniref:TransglutaminaseTgpA domain-containing protein n=1 Tax=Nocardiopsis sediminis TaxID=1778267 RepID=A0ABV8FUG3_9ACTN
MIARTALTVAAALAVLLALPLLAPLFTGDGWWHACVLVVGLVAAAGAGLRATRLTPALLPLAQALAALAALTAVFTPESALGGFLPTPASLEALLATFAEGRDMIELTPPPVASEPGVSLVIAVCIGLAAIIADFCAVTARAAALVGLPLSGLVVVPLVVDDAGVGWGAFSLAAAGYALLLGVDSWIRASGWGVYARAAHEPAAPVVGGLRHAFAGAGVAAAAIVPALLLPAALPGLTSSALHGLADATRLGGETVTTTHPLVSLRRDLASTGDGPVLTYETSAERPEYLRMYVLDEFDGVNWTMSPVEASGDTMVGGDPLPAPAGLADQDAERATTRIALAPEASVDFLPLPYPAAAVDIDGDWFADPESLMVFTTTPQDPGLAYEVESILPRPDAAALEGRTAPAAGVDRRYLAVPESVDPRVAELAESITAGSASPHERAVALQSWFTGDDRFEYSLRPPPLPTGSDPLSYFLFDSRIGYCEQFAAAMTLMARQLDIPARVAIGYTSGTSAGEGRWEVSESDAHAWPELYFPGEGWLRFEPTPASDGGQGTATVPPYAQSAPEPEDAPSAAPEPEAPERSEADDEAAPSQDASAPPEAAGPADSAEDGAAGTGWDAVAAWWPVLPAAAAVALLAAAPALARMLVRRVARIRAGTPRARADAAWREVRDDARDAGVGWNPAESPRAAAARIAAERSLPAEGREALWRVAMAQESACYAPDPAAVPESLEEDVRAVRTALRASLGRAALLRAVLLPRSLLPLHATREGPASPEPA